MSFTLYDATVSNYIQTLGAVSGLLDTAEQFCADRGLAPDEILQARLAADMQPFAYQVKSTVVHSIGAIESVRRGAFSPDDTEPAASFAALRTLVGQAIAALQGLDPADINSFVGRDMHFVAGPRSIEFAAEDFLMSFAHPNFYFHATTAYDILRYKGVPIGKRNFLGRFRKRR